MRENGSVENTEKYSIAEYEPRGLRLKDLAERIASQLDSYFILYDYKGNIYTNNENVIQILKDEYPSGNYPAYSNPTDGFSYDNMNIEWDSLLQLQENGNYAWADYTYIPKWYYIYRKLAKLLVSFRGNNILVDDPINSNSVGNLLYRELISDKDFIANNEWIIKFDSKWKVKSLDPIHIFASLNNNKLGYDKRIKRINILFRILDDNFKDDYKDINFDGCPAPMTINIIGARDEDTQKEVWNTFYEIMDKSQNSEINFSKIREWYGIDIGAFTIFLFWIDAKNFLPLDKNTDNLLAKSERKFTFPKTYEEYKKLLIKKNTNIYLILALVSYNRKLEKTLDTKDKEKLSYYLNYIATDDNWNPIPGPEIKAIHIPEDHIEVITNFRPNVRVEIVDEDIVPSNNFKLIAIRPLSKCNEKYIKTLKEEEYYIFDKSYMIEGKKIIVNANTDISLFDLDNMKLNINAIVGKNGTGKSTIVELLFALIYNISILKEILKNREDNEESEEIKKIEDLNVELFYENDYIYKIVLENNDFKCFKYKKDNNYAESNNEKSKKYKFNLIEDNIADSFSIENLFYTIAVNYSQHSFNSINIGGWIKSLFHKNDAYQTPIVIEPYRKNGDIDVNKQESLVKQRLLANLLLQLEDGINKENNPRQLTEFYEAIELKITFNESRFKDKYSEIRAKFLGDITEENKTLLYSIFNIDFENISHSLKQYIEDYIFIKLIKISLTYEHYYKYFKKNRKLTKPKEYFERLLADDSHITYKLKQAVNFLKYKDLQFENMDILNIEEHSDNIEKIKQKNNDEVINRYLPPTLFDIDIILEDDINFTTLSSGEKQKIYSVNSILYHINNVNSVEENLHKYKHINIILDEIELYFHPELQRNYLSHLHHTISKSNSNNILAVNILFVTHSPFILSDIPDTKILFLEKQSQDKGKELKTIPSKKEIKTFGANIHELLINGFFMNNSIGEFALKEIKAIVKFHHEVISIKEESLLKDKEKSYNDLKDRFYFIQEHIGEDYISGIVKNHLIDIERKLNSNSFKSKRIEDLKKELEDLQRDTND